MAESMDTSRKAGHEGDIATEPYKGVGRGVAAAGGAFIAHWVAAFIGLIAGGVAGGFFPKQVSAIEKGFEEFSKGASPGFFMRMLRGAAGLIQQGSEHMSELITKRSFFEPLVNRFKINPKRVDAIIFGGGITALMGFIGSSLLYGGRAFAQAGEGKAQFERARREIIEMREQYDTLRDKYMRTRMELEDIRTTRDVNQGKLNISGDDPGIRPRNYLDAPALGEKPGTLVSAVAREAAVAATPAKEVAAN